MKSRFVTLAIAGLIASPALADTQPPAGAKKLSEIVRSLEDKGYAPIYDVSFDDGAWEAEAVREGQKREVRVDPLSGQVISERADD